MLDLGFIGGLVRIGVLAVLLDDGTSAHTGAKPITPKQEKVRLRLVR